jgi:hypothetical protein
VRNTKQSTIIGNLTVMMKFDFGHQAHPKAPDQNNKKAFEVMN